MKELLAILSPSRAAPNSYSSALADTHQSPWTVEMRLHRTKLIVVFGLMAGFAISPKLWLSSRLYPLSPVFDILPSILPPIDLLILFSLFALLVAMLFSGRPRRLILAFVFLSSVLCLLDQSRLQPWFYQYVFLLLPLSISSTSKGESASKSSSISINACRLIVASIYFYAGLQKANGEFTNKVFPWMAEPLTVLMPSSLTWIVHWIAFQIPIIEMLIGIGLVIPRLRNLAIFFASAMLLFVMYTLGPFGRN